VLIVIGEVILSCRSSDFPDLVSRITQRERNLEEARGCQVFVNDPQTALAPNSYAAVRTPFVTRTCSLW
jgi:hypothetical protein